MAKRLIVLLLALCMMSSIFLASCSKKNPSGTTTKTTEASSKDPDVTQTPEEELNRPADMDFDGYKFQILANTNNFGGDYPQWVWDSDSDPKTILEQAVASRENVLFNRYGIDTVLVPTSSAAMALMNAANSNLYICDVAAIPGKTAATLVQMDCYYNLNAISELNLSASYYDQRIQEDFDIGGKLYMLEGDFTYRDDFTTMMFAYNKTVYDTYLFSDKYGTPYEMVRDGNWTYANMLSMATEATQDLNSDGTYDVNDRFGLITVTSFPYNMMMAAGLKTVDAKGGTVSLTMSNATYQDRVLNCVSTIMDNIKGINGMRVILPHDMQDWGAASDARASEAARLFIENRNLFRETTLSAVRNFVSADVKYGVLPMPTYYEGQTEYYNVVAVEDLESLTIVKCGQTDVSKIGAIVERFAYHSRYTDATYNMHDAFYSYLTELKLCQIAADQEMMRLILESKVYDCDTLWSVTGFLDAVRTLQWNNQTDQLISTLKTRIEESKTNLDKINKAIGSLS